MLQSSAMSKLATVQKRLYNINGIACQTLMDKYAMELQEVKL